MQEDSRVARLGPQQAVEDPLTEVLRQGAKRLLAQAVEAEVAAFLAVHGELVDEAGRRRPAGVC